MEKQVLVKAEKLTKYFPVTKGLFRHTVANVKAVDGIDMEIREGETLGLVGESGCGKSTLGRTILRLIPATSGKLWFEGQNIYDLSENEMRGMRQKMQLIFQDPYASLNPRMTILDIVSEPLLIHRPEMKAAERKERAVEMLKVVGMNEHSLSRYPHEFSGGQRQRVCIARALILRPQFVVCDEPVSALDVSVRSQVLNLMQELQDKLHLTYLFISHDLSVVKHISNRVAVMYLGKIVELADRKELFANPQHPYTRALMSAIPVPDPTVNVEREILAGDLPSPANPPEGCRFHTRCRFAAERCRREVPALTAGQNGHQVACFLCHEETESRGETR